MNPKNPNWIEEEDGYVKNDKHHTPGKSPFTKPSPAPSISDDLLYKGEFPLKQDGSGKVDWDKIAEEKSKHA